MSTHRLTNTIAIDFNEDIFPWDHEQDTVQLELPDGEIDLLEDVVFVDKRNRKKRRRGWLAHLFIDTSHYDSSRYVMARFHLREKDPR